MRRLKSNANKPSFTSIRRRAISENRNAAIEINVLFLDISLN